MALSNWDTLAIDETGSPTSGTFISPLGIEVSLYKNWLYVRDNKAWEDGGSYIHPTVMKVISGDLTYKDVTILAKRGPQEGVFAVVSSGANYDNSLKLMVGCGVYGFSGDDWIGVNADSTAFLEALLQELVEEDSWDEESREKSVYAKLAASLSSASRFNQGDAYFARNLGFEVPKTSPGEAEEPILTKLFPA